MSQSNERVTDEQNYRSGLAARHGKSWLKKSPGVYIHRWKAWVLHSFAEFCEIVAVYSVLPYLNNLLRQKLQQSRRQILSWGTWPSVELRPFNPGCLTLITLSLFLGASAMYHFYCGSTRRPQPGRRRHYTTCCTDVEWEMVPDPESLQLQ